MPLCAAGPVFKKGRLILTIYVSEIIWTVVCFLVLLVVLKKLLFDPILTFMDAREEKLAHARKAGENANAARADADAALAEARRKDRADANALLSEARARDEQARAEAVSAVKQETAQTMKQARAELREAELREREQLEAKAPELAGALADALLRAETE